MNSPENFDQDRRNTDAYLDCPVAEASVVGTSLVVNFAAALVHHLTVGIFATYLPTNRAIQTHRKLVQSIQLRSINSEKYGKYGNSLEIVGFLCRKWIKKKETPY